MFLHEMFQTNDDQDLYFLMQKRICSQYIRLASEKLSHEEACRISQANDLLQKISTNDRSKDTIEWDVFSTQGSVVGDNDDSATQLNLSVQIKSRVISRRGAFGAKSNRQFDSSLIDSLSEIQKSCSEKTASLTKKLVDEYKKLKSRILEVQKKEKVLKSKQKLIEELQQKNMIFSKRIEDLEGCLQKLKEQSTSIKNQNKNLNENLHKKNHAAYSQKKGKPYEQKMNNKSDTTLNPEFNSSNFAFLNQFLAEKENIINMRLQSIKNLQQKVETFIFGENNSCGSCCALLKRLKGSIVNYKQYLQKEGDQFECLVNNFKQKLQKQNTIKSITS